MKYLNSRLGTAFVTGAGLTLLITIFIWSGCQTPPAENPSADESPHVSAPDPVAAGRYIVTIGGCNDCHTDGYLQTEGDVPESEWLKGSSLGWRGPWGTTYARNLRLTADSMTEDAFVAMVQTRKALPPMPWMNVNKMSDTDARAVYAYLKSLGPDGEQPPDPLPPGVEPNTPFLLLEPQNLPTE